MEKIKLEITQEQLSNLMVFLNRVDYKGFKEVNAIQELMVILQQPLLSDTKEK